MMETLRDGHAGTVRAIVGERGARVDPRKGGLARLDQARDQVETTPRICEPYARASPTTSGWTSTVRDGSPTFLWVLLV